MKQPELHGWDTALSGKIPRSPESISTCHPSNECKQFSKQIPAFEPAVAEAGDLTSSLASSQ
jgi:hypothetical protein